MRAATAAPSSSSSNGTAASAPGAPDRPVPAPAAASRRNPEVEFPVRLTRAMHAAVRAHRDQLAEEMELRRIAITAAIRDQRRADALHARQAAAEGRRAVDRWAATAQRQIKSEKQRRHVEIDANLRMALREQNRLVDRRMRKIDAALAAYQTELDAFFDAIDRERDPEAIALQARERPRFPDLSEIDEG